MLDAHEDDPHVTIPVDLFLLALLYDVDHHFFYLVSVNFCIFHRRPFIVRLIQIVPVHLVDTDCEHPFIWLVDPFGNKTLIEELVHEKGCSMTVVEDQGVSQWFRLGVIRATVLYDCK